MQLLLLGSWQPCHIGLSLRHERCMGPDGLGSRRQTLTCAKTYHLASWHCRHQAAGCCPPYSGMSARKTLAWPCSQVHCACTDSRQGSCFSMWEDRWISGAWGPPSRDCTETIQNGLASGVEGGKGEREPMFLRSCPAFPRPLGPSPPSSRLCIKLCKAGRRERLETQTAAILSTALKPQRILILKKNGTLHVYSQRKRLGSPVTLKPPQKSQPAWD